MITIRNVDLLDAPRLLEIYSYYVEQTAISFECTVPTIEEFINRIKSTITTHPYFVLEDDGVIQGYAYAGPFKPREAYKYSCELTIYLDKRAHKRGYGRMLYEAVEKQLVEMNITNVYSCIGDPIVEDEYLTHNSEQFHEHMGFIKVGEFHKCGYKFQRYYNMIWMEKIIGEY